MRANPYHPTLADDRDRLIAQYVQRIDTLIAINAELEAENQRLRRELASTPKT